MTSDRNESMVARLEKELSSVSRRGLIPVAIYLGNLEFNALRLDSHAPSRVTLGEGWRFHGIPLHRVDEIEHFAVMGETRSNAPVWARRW